VQTKVVTQTIAPGTSVAVGTTIDVVLTRTADLPVAVIPGIHVAFQTETMASCTSASPSPLSCATSCGRRPPRPS